MPAIGYPVAGQHIINLCNLGSNSGMQQEEISDIYWQTFVVYHGYVQIAEIDATDETAPFVTKTYRWDPSEPVATRPLALSLWTREGTVRETLYYAHNLRKNVVSLFDGKGLRRASYQYDPYGNITSMEGDMAKENPFRFSSEYHDENLGLVYYNYRHYNPTDGRWISRDPIAEKGGVNLYGFVRNRAGWIGDWLGLADYIFESQTFIKQEAYGTHLRASMFANAIHDAKKFTKGIASKAISAYELLKQLTKVLNTGGVVNGDQFRVFIKFSCECKDGFLWCFRSKMNMQTKSFFITPKDIPSDDADYPWGFVQYPSNIDAVIKEMDQFIGKKVYEITKYQEERCKHYCDSK